MKFFVPFIFSSIVFISASAQQADSKNKSASGTEWKNTNQEKRVQPSASGKNANEQTEKNIPAQTQTVNDTVAIISSKKKPEN